MTTCTELSPSMIREAEERAARNPDSLLNRLRAAREPQIEWTDCTPQEAHPTMDDSTKILAALRERTLTLKEIIRRTGIAASACQGMVTRLIDSGKVQPAGRGRYTLAGRAPTPQVEDDDDGDTDQPAPPPRKRARRVTGSPLTGGSDLVLTLILGDMKFTGDIEQTRHRLDIIEGIRSAMK